MPLFWFCFFQGFLANFDLRFFVFFRAWSTVSCVFDGIVVAEPPSPASAGGVKSWNKWRWVHLHMSTAIYYDDYKITSAILCSSPPSCASYCSDVLTASRDLSEFLICDIRWICQCVQVNSNTFWFRPSHHCFVFVAMPWCVFNVSPLIVWGPVGNWCVSP